jgi:hypothetical protein
MRQSGGLRRVRTRFPSVAHEIRTKLISHVALFQDFSERMPKRMRTYPLLRNTRGQQDRFE